jgi:hypothetical protein
VGLVWRVDDQANYWRIVVSLAGAKLERVESGASTTVATDTTNVMKRGVSHSLQILDSGREFGCYLDGIRLFDSWFDDLGLADATGAGVWWGAESDAHVRDFEAHPRALPIPSAIKLKAPWSRLGSRIRFTENFVGGSGELAGCAVTLGDAAWEKTVGSGVVECQEGRAKVRASVATPNPGRTFYTLPWADGQFADLTVRITPAGTKRGEGNRCRCGLVFWQDQDNYLSATTWLDDVYDGASISVFPKRNGFEELYDAVWTMVSHKVRWGVQFELRIAFDGCQFVIYVNDEPVMQRSLTDIYPTDQPLQIKRVGIAVNWEWGNDTGSVFDEFVARS